MIRLVHMSTRGAFCILHLLINDGNVQCIQFIRFCTLLDANVFIGTVTIRVILLVSLSISQQPIRGLIKEKR